jgi:AcrR family transcriptional regulator
MFRLKSDIETARRGRPRDAAAHRAILDAALALIDEVGLSALTFESIAERSGVGRPTLYRWWPNKAAIVLEALLDHTATAAPYPDTGDIESDLRQQCRAYVRVLTGRHANAYRLVFAEAQGDETTAVALRSTLIEPRRAATRKALDLAIRRGQLRDDLDLDVVIDQLYAPFVYRLLLGHAPLNNKAVDAIIDHALMGLRPRQRSART